MKRAAALLLLASACGDPIVDGDYLGEPLFRVSGRIEGDAGTSRIHSPWLAMLWAELQDGEVGEPRLIVTMAPISDHRFPGSFTIDFYDVPPPSVQMPLLGHRVAMGIAVVVDDVDGNGRFEVDPVVGVIPPDRMFGWAQDQTILYVAEVGSERCQRWAFGDAVAPGAGYHVATWGACDTGTPFEIQPPGEPLVVTLFPPGAFPEETERELGEDVCQVPDCESDPGSPACELAEAGDRCFEELCMPLHEEVVDCAFRWCSGVPDDGECFAERCGRLQEQADRCALVDCSFEALCAE